MRTKQKRVRALTGKRWPVKLYPRGTHVLAEIPSVDTDVFGLARSFPKRSCHLTPHVAKRMRDWLHGWLVVYDDEHGTNHAHIRESQ